MNECSWYSLSYISLTYLLYITYYSDEELVYINDVMDLVLFNADNQTEDVLLDNWFLVIYRVVTNVLYE